MLDTRRNRDGPPKVDGRAGTGTQRNGGRSERRSDVLTNMQNFHNICARTESNEAILSTLD